VKAPKGFNLKLAYPRQAGKQTYCSFARTESLTLALIQKMSDLWFLGFQQKRHDQPLQHGSEIALLKKIFA